MNKQQLKKIAATIGLVTTLNLALLPMCFNATQTASNTTEKTLSERLESGEKVEVADFFGIFTFTFGSLSITTALRSCNPMLQQCGGGGVGIGTQHEVPLS